MNGADDINYQPLEVDTHAFKTVWRAYRVGDIAIIAITVPLVLAGLVHPAGLLPLTQVGFCLFVFWVIYLSLKINAFKNGAWEAFALANGWPIDSVEDPETLIPLSIQFGYEPNLSPVITAQLGDIPADLYVLSVWVGEGRERRQYFETVARVDLPKVLPHMVLRAKKDSAYLQQDLADHEKLELEGDFGDYFTLEIEKGQEVDALAILTPDVMQTLVTYSQKEDIEIAGACLYFIINGDERRPDVIKQVTQSVTQLSGKIVEHIIQTTAPEALAPSTETVPPVSRLA